MIVDCLQDLPQIQISRKTFLQVIMREMNQYLYREVNTLQVSNYVDIDRYSWSKDGSVTTTTTVTNRTTDSYLVDNSSSQVKSFAFSRRFIVLTLRRRFGDLTSFDLFSIQYLNRNTKYVPDDWPFNYVLQSVKYWLDVEQAEVEVGLAPALPPKNPIPSMGLDDSSTYSNRSYSQIQEYGAFEPTFNQVSWVILIRTN